MEHIGVLPTAQFAYRKGLSSCDVLYVLHTLQCALESGRRLGSYRFISAPPLIVSSIMEFCISSVLCVLEVLCCLY